MDKNSQKFTEIHKNSNPNEIISHNHGNYIDELL